ncbi:hypothetical protein EVAR_36731_1 [Eumeta japonica]|uniref:Uncharacterized protein n=1 Tax=Eumeta variegata TaxID=151549 RepID=A0A4C1X3Y2_EUMVA|nr:hypothetical protein EVAR_36731_1 [Eumeta japonica]
MPAIILDYHLCPYLPPYRKHRCVTSFWVVRWRRKQYCSRVRHARKLRGRPLLGRCFTFDSSHRRIGRYVRGWNTIPVRSGSKADPSAAAPFDIIYRPRSCRESAVESPENFKVRRRARVAISISQINVCLVGIAPTLSAARGVTTSLASQVVIKVVSIPGALVVQEEPGRLVTDGGLVTSVGGVKLIGRSSRAEMLTACGRR